MKTITRTPIATLLEHNIRTSYDQEALQRLAESLKKGQKTPILISGTRIIDGHRRVAAAKLGGITHLDAIDCGDMTAEEITDFQTVHAFHSETLSDFDRAGALKRAKDQGLSNKQIAERFDINPSAVTQYLALFDCVPEVIQAAKEGKIGPSSAYTISKSPDQLASLALKLGGATRDEVAKASKKGKEDASKKEDADKGDDPKPDSVKITLEGATISIKGTGLTLAGISKLLLEAGREANAGVKDGQGTRTFSRLMADRAKKAAEDAKAAAKKAAETAVTP